MTTNSILVIGAGELGTAVLEGLAKHPELTSSKGNITLSVMMRGGTASAPVALAKQMHQRYLRDTLGVSGLVPGDLARDSAEDLAAAFRPFDTIICCAGFGDAFPAGTQLKIARAVLLAASASAASTNNDGSKPTKPKRFLPWQWGMDYDAIGTGTAQDLFDEQLQVRALLRAETEKKPGAVAWVIVSTGLFMSFLFRADFGVVDLPGRTVRCLGEWDTRITVTTPRDIGVMAAEVVLRPGDISNQVIYVAGDTVSYGRVAELVELRFGSGSGSGTGAEAFKREAWDREFLKQKLAENPGDVMLKYRSCFAEGRGVAFNMEDTVNKQRGIVLQDVQSYLKEMEL